ncbi:uncharacterized protein LOC120909420 isoform X1 [Rana temporaria]|uniref:uncharacterized protein LOC120909420 isoform X1 n=2 Tax=Rana temporaria TaxID=8407 RepID=UPI001AAD3191|nr:uncharacterized protein LOC120909420 isoform X1 [Rana temporaria]
MAEKNQSQKSFPFTHDADHQGGWALLLQEVNETELGAMEANCTDLTERILRLTLEIIYLLTGEDNIVVEKTSGDGQNPITVPLRYLLVPERNNEKKILEVSQKIIDLLMRESGIWSNYVGIKEEITEKKEEDGVMKERKCLGHKDLYKDVMMENQPPLTSPDGSSNGNPPERRPHSFQEVMAEPFNDTNPPERCPRPLYSRDYTQEDHTISYTVREEIKEEEEEVDAMDEFSEGHRDPFQEVMAEPFSDTTPPERCPHPLYSGDSTQEDLTISNEVKEEIKAEEDEFHAMDEFSEGHRDPFQEVMAEPFNDTTPPERCPHSLYSGDSTHEDHTISNTVREEIKEEEEEVDAMEEFSEAHRDPLQEVVEEQFNDTTPPERCPHSLYSGDSTQEDFTISNEVKEEIKEEEDEIEVTKTFPEGHKDPFKEVMVEQLSDAHLQYSIQEDHNYTQPDQGEELKDIKVEIKEEEEERLVSGDQQCMVEEEEKMMEIKQEESSLHMDTNGSCNGNPPERCPRSLNSRDSTQEDPTIPHHHQEEVLGIKLEVEEVDETYVICEQLPIEEQVMVTITKAESLLDVSSGGGNVWKTPAEHPFLSADCKKENTGMAQYPPGLIIFTPNVYHKPKPIKKSKVRFICKPHNYKPRTILPKGQPIICSAEQLPDLSNHKESSEESKDKLCTVIPTVQSSFHILGKLTDPSNHKEPFEVSKDKPCTVIPTVQASFHMAGQPPDPSNHKESSEVSKDKPRTVIPTVQPSFHILGQLPDLSNQKESSEQSKDKPCTVIPTVQPSFHILGQPTDPSNHKEPSEECKAKPLTVIPNVQASFHKAGKPPDPSRYKESLEESKAKARTVIPTVQPSFHILGQLPDLSNHKESSEVSKDKQHTVIPTVQPSFHILGQPTDPSNCQESSEVSKDKLCTVTPTVQPSFHILGQPTDPSNCQESSEVSKDKPRTVNPTVQPSFHILGQPTDPSNCKESSEVSKDKPRTVQPSFHILGQPTDPSNCQESTEVSKDQPRTVIPTVQPSFHILGQPTDPSNHKESSEVSKDQPHTVTPTVQPSFHRQPKDPSNHKEPSEESKDKSHTVIPGVQPSFHMAGQPLDPSNYKESSDESKNKPHTVMPDVQTSFHIAEKTTEPSNPEESSPSNFHSLKDREKSSLKNPDPYVNQKTHASKKWFSCSECEKSFKRKTDLVRHHRVHTGEKPHSCPECGKGFGSKVSRDGHVRTHTGEKPFCCSECGKCFAQKITLDNHCFQQHVDLHELKASQSCSECGKSFEERSEFHVHQSGHTSKEICYCPGSEKLAKRKCDPVEHQITDTEKPPFSCCKDSWKNVRHQRSHKGEKKSFSCSECGKTFKDRWNLKTHQIVHTGERPFTCSECGKGYSSKGTLNKHMRIHTGERPFSCLECGKRFTYKHTLIIHQSIHTRRKIYPKTFT